MEDMEAQEMRVQERSPYKQLSKSCRVETGPGVVDGRGWGRLLAIRGRVQDAAGASSEFARHSRVLRYSSDHLSPRQAAKGAGQDLGKGSLFAFLLCKIAFFINLVCGVCTHAHVHMYVNAHTLAHACRVRG